MPPSEFNRAVLDQLRDISGKLDGLADRMTRVEALSESKASQIDVAALEQRIRAQERECEANTLRIEKHIAPTEQRLRAIELSLAQHREHELEKPRAIARVGAAAGGGGVFVGVLVEWLVRIIAGW